MSIQWHYPRQVLADNFLHQFATGITSALTLFSPRRMGKTEFLIADLAPSAAKQGYHVIYCSFWELRDNPVKSLLLAIEEAEKNTSFVQRLSELTQRQLTGVEVAITSKGINAKAKTERTVAAEDELEALSIAFSRLARKRSSILMLLDEVQHLGTKPEFEKITFLLRTVFDKHVKKFKVIYTGSSRDGLQRLFQRRKSPLFHSAQQIDLPKLDESFVNHMLSAFRQASGRTLSRSAGLKIFKDLHAVPYLFHTFLKQLLISGESLKTAVPRFMQEFYTEGEYSHQWKQLAALDQAILKWLSKDMGGAYTDEARDFFADIVGVEKIATHSVQNAINRLRKKGLLNLVGHGELIFEDSHFEIWIQDQ